MMSFMVVHSGRGGVAFGIHRSGIAEYFDVVGVVVRFVAQNTGLFGTIVSLQKNGLISLFAFKTALF